MISQIFQKNNVIPCPYCGFRAYSVIQANKLLQTLQRECLR